MEAAEAAGAALVATDRPEAGVDAARPVKPVPAPKPAQHIKCHLVILRHWGLATRTAPGSCFPSTLQSAQLSTLILFANTKLLRRQGRST